MRFWSIAASLVLLSTQAVSAAEESESGRVLRGILVVQESPDDVPVVLQPGDDVPSLATFRVAEIGPCLIRWTGVSVALAAGSSGRFEPVHNNEPAAGVELTAGRGVLQTRAAAARWILPGRTLRLEPQSQSQLAVELPTRFRLALLNGKARLETGGFDQPAAIAPFEGAAVWDLGKKQFTPQPLVEEDRRLAAELSVDAPPAQGLGQLMIQDAQSNAPIRLNVARYHAHVVLQPPVALVQIDQSFYNPHGTQQEGTFLFNLPGGASVSRFAMYVTPTELIEGELIERARAADIYDSIVRRRRDPAILEQIGDNLFRMRVFPVFARDTKRILLDFTLPLESHDGRYRFRLPLLSDLKPVWDFRISGVVRGPTLADSLHSDSHLGLKFEPRADKSIALEFAQQNFQPDRDLVLTFAQPVAQTATLQNSRVEPLPPRAPSAPARAGQPAADPGTPDPLSQRPLIYFRATLPPRPRDPAAAAPADVLILADTSSGMSNLDSIRPAVRAVLRGLRPDDRFQLACVDVGSRFLTPDWTAAESKSVGSVLKKFDREFCLGGTDLPAAFAEAVEKAFAGQAERRRLVIYIGDGVNTTGRLHSTQVQTELSRSLQPTGAAMVGILARYDAGGERLLQEVARKSGGLVFDAGGAAGFADLSSWLLEGLPHPQRILSVSATGAVALDLFYPFAWRDGQPLPVLGRCPPAEKLGLTVTTLRPGGEPQEQQVELAFAPDDDIFLGRLWAQEKLVALGHQDDTVLEATQQRILGLSQEWSLLSPLTAFLVLEKEADYATWNVDRSQRRRYWKPTDQLAQPPLPQDWLRQVTDGLDLENGLPPTQWSILFDNYLKKARAALDAGNLSLAAKLLSHARKTARRRAGDSAKFAELNLKLKDLGQQRFLLDAREEIQSEAVEPFRSLIDPSFRTLRESPPELMPLLMGRISPQYLEHHRFARELLTEVEVQPMSMSLLQLAQFVKGRTGRTVLIDRADLEAEGVEVDAEYPLKAWGRVSLANFVRYCQTGMGLPFQMVEDGEAFRIVTNSQCRSLRELQIYPVADLLFTERVADVGLLVDPFVDRETEARLRIGRKMQQLVSAEFVNTPLTDVIAYFQRVLNDNVLISLANLEAEGIETDTPITESVRNLSVEAALRQILRGTFAGFAIQHETLVISSEADIQSTLETRVHSARGLIHEYASDDAAAAKRRDPRFPAWGGGFGGGLGGAAFGGGGMGGGFGGGGIGGSPFGSGNSTGGASEMLDRVSRSGNVALSEEGAAAGTPLPAPAIDETGADSGFGVLPDATPEDGTEMIGDVQHVKDLIQAHTGGAPDTPWIDVDGEGGDLDYFEPTSDFVVNAAARVHDDVEKFLNTLRKLPIVAAPQSGVRPALTRQVGAGNALEADFSGLISVLLRHSGSAPDSPWLDVDGEGGAIDRDPLRMILLVTQTADGHEKIWNLLTQLRRSRYEAVRHSRPWENLLLSGGSLWAYPDGHARLVSDVRLDPLPAGSEAALRELAARGEEPFGLTRWKRWTGDGTELPAATLQRNAQRWMCDLGDVIVKAGGDDVAAGYPGLRLVEFGTWGESARRQLDERFPWLPHRTNEELARMFDVKPLASADDDLVTLQLTFRGVAAEVAWIEATFSQKQQKLPTAWRTFLNGQLTQQFQFSDFTDKAGPPRWQKITLESAEGRPLARWELVESAAQVEISSIRDGWAGYLPLDQRAIDSNRATQFSRALVAMRRHEWKDAIERLESAKQESTRRSLLQLLQAWCWGFGREELSEAQVVAGLREVVGSNLPGLRDFLTARNLTWLAPGDLYSILLEQPEASRSAHDWDMLAQAASDGGLLPEALKCVDAALRLGPAPERRFPLTRMRVQQLVQLDQKAAGHALALEWAARPETTRIERIELADLLRALQSREVAETLYKQALADPQLPPAARRDLLLRQAKLYTGVPRFRMLLTAHALLPADSSLRAPDMEDMLAELQDTTGAAWAGELAAEIADPALKARFLIRQAELTPDAAVVGDLTWSVWESGRLPPDHVGWATSFMNQAGQFERVIRIVESRLRAREAVDAVSLQQLQFAYRSAKRPIDALRAETTDKPAGPRANTGTGFFSVR